jgi:MFS transporter, DHA1 family, inner membrane transport protein
MPPILWLFCLCNLVIGSAAFLVTGTLTPLSQGLGVSVQAAGQAMSAYALATAVLAPLALLATGKMNRRSALLLAMGVFAAGNTVCALAPSLPVLLAGRALMGLGAFFMPVAAGIAITLVPAAQRGKALAMVFLGMSLSYVIGVPLGAYTAAQFGWQAPFWGATAALLLMMAAVAWSVPRDIEAPSATFEGLGTLLIRPTVVQALGTTALYFTAIFIVFSYIGPVLKALAGPEGMDAKQLAVTLALFGCSGVLGTLVGGAANDRFGALPTLRVQLSVLGTTMLLLPLTAGQPLATLAVMLAWGTAGFGMMAPQQSRLAALSPAQTPILLSLNASMVYIGTALGAVLGGLASVHLGFAQLGWAGLPFVACALALLWFAQNSRPAGALPAR